MRVEVIYALPEGEGYYVSCQVPESSTVEQVLRYLDFFSLYPEVDRAKNKIGIFGKPVEMNYLLAEGDRIEIYRPIYVDPKVARRKKLTTTK